MTAGTLLVSAAAKAGLYGLMVRTSGPQIRGGEAAALVRLGRQPIETLDDTFDLLLAIDWQNVNRFVDEIPLTRRAVSSSATPTKAIRRTCSRRTARATSRCR